MGSWNFGRAILRFSEPSLADGLSRLRTFVVSAESSFGGVLVSRSIELPIQFSFSRVTALKGTGCSLSNRVGWRSFEFSIGII